MEQAEIAMQFEFEPLGASPARIPQIVRQSDLGCAGCFTPTAMHPKLFFGGSEFIPAT
jgi:hypothetical protein